MNHDAAGRLAGISAVEVEPDAVDQLLEVVLGQTGVCATGTGAGTVEAAFDGTEEQLAIEAARVRVEFDDFANCHVITSLVRAAS